MKNLLSIFGAFVLLAVAVLPAGAYWNWDYLVQVKNISEADSSTGGNKQIDSLKFEDADDFDFDLDGAMSEKNMMTGHALAEANLSSEINTNLKTKPSWYMNYNSGDDIKVDVFNKAEAKAKTGGNLQLDKLEAEDNEDEVEFEAEDLYSLKNMTTGEAFSNSNLFSVVNTNLEEKSGFMPMFFSWIH